MRSADIPGPGKRFGHDVTIRSFFVCARATDGAAIAPAKLEPTRPAAMVRRVIFVMSSPVSVEMMERTVAVADFKFVGGGDAGGDVILGGADRGGEVETLGETGRNGGRQRAAGAMRIA
jgi:hypothetical protein